MKRAAGVCTAVLVLAAALVSPTADAAPRTRPDGPMIIAHRGGTGDFPENTILAITNAVAEGVDGLWLTVQASSDNVPVLFRPSDLSSLTNGTGAVNTKTAAELGQLNAGWTFGEGDGYPYRERAMPIPALEQVIAAVPAGMPLFLDL